jgi:hypothetical protein
MVDSLSSARLKFRLIEGDWLGVAQQKGERKINKKDPGFVPGMDRGGKFSRFPRICGFCTKVPKNE